MRLFRVASFILLFTAFTSPAPAQGTGGAPALSQTSDLAISVLPRHEFCAEAEPCSMVVHILNQGGAPYGGPVEIFVDLHAPAVLPPASADGPRCTREDYGKFRCELANVDLAPGSYTAIEPEFLFTATAYEASKACAALRWTPESLAERDRLLAAAIKESGHSAAELMKAAGLTGGDSSRSALLSALIGQWGEGDAAAVNDTACATIGIVDARQAVSCEEGEIRVDGACVPLARWCPSNLEHSSAADRCACPSALAHWNSGTGKCEGRPAPLACAAPDADPAQYCRCPADRPVLNAGKGACVTVEKAVAIVAPPPAPEHKDPMATKEPAKHVAKADLDCANCRVKEREKARAPRRKPPQSAVFEPKRRSDARKPAARATASLRGKRRCRALQVWGPHLRRCIPLPIYLMGRMFAPAAASECPSGQRLVNGRCRKR